MFIKICHVQTSEFSTYLSTLYVFQIQYSGIWQCNLINPPVWRAVEENGDGLICFQNIVYFRIFTRWCERLVQVVTATMSNCCFRWFFKNIWRCTFFLRLHIGSAIITFTSALISFNTNVIVKLNNSIPNCFSNYSFQF